MGENDRLFWFTDMGWIMGPWEVVGGLALGGMIVLYEGVPDWPNPARIWEIVERHYSITIPRRLADSGPRVDETWRFVRESDR